MISAGAGLSPFGLHLASKKHVNKAKRAAEAAGVEDSTVSAGATLLTPISVTDAHPVRTDGQTKTPTRRSRTATRGSRDKKEECQVEGSDSRAAAGGKLAASQFRVCKN